MLNYKAISEEQMERAGLDEIPVEEFLEILPVLVGDWNAYFTVDNAVALYDPDGFKVDYDERSVLHAQNS